MNYPQSHFTLQTMMTMAIISDDLSTNDDGDVGLGIYTLTGRWYFIPLTLILVNQREAKTTPVLF